MSDRELVRAELERQLGDTYDCARVWEAWSVGTMDEDDFVPATERLDEITDAVLAALSAAGWLRAEVAGGVVEECAKVIAHGYWGELPEKATWLQRKRSVGHWCDRDEVRADIRSIVGIIAADAERRVRTEILRQLTDVQDDPHFSSEYGNGFDHAVSIVKDSNKCSTP